MPPADGWWLMAEVATKLHDIAAKMVKSLRAYEFAMKVQFTSDLPVSVLLDKQAEYGDLFVKRAQTNKPPRKRK